MSEMKQMNNQVLYLIATKKIVQNLPRLFDFLSILVPLKISIFLTCSSFNAIKVSEVPVKLLEPGTGTSFHLKPT